MECLPYCFTGAVKPYASFDTPLSHINANSSLVDPSHTFSNTDSHSISAVSRAISRAVSHPITRIIWTGSSSNASVLPEETEDVTCKYNAGPKLGTGAYGIVVGCVDKLTFERFACKTIDLRRLHLASDKTAHVKRLRQEIAIMAHLAGHGNIVTLHDVYESKSHVFIIEELCAGGSLLAHIRMGRMCEARIAHLFRGIIQAVMHCHLMGVMHRDIKPDNIMLSSKRTDADIKLSDFGLASFFRHGEHFSETVGSPYFMAPEVHKKGERYGPEADTWSCGVCLYQMLSDGEHPFPGATAHEVFALVRGPCEVGFVGTKWWTVSPDAKDLVAHMLKKSASRRIPLTEVLNHPWLRRHKSQSIVHLPMRSPSFMFQHFSRSNPARNISVEPSAGSRHGGNAVLNVWPPKESNVLDFVVTFRDRVEGPYIHLLQASNAAEAAVAWATMKKGFRELDDRLAHQASLLGCRMVGGYFLGKVPSVAEAATASTLWRMNATLPAVREMQPLDALCQTLGLVNLTRWVKHTLANPTQCCNVAVLPDTVYVRMARRLFVKYVGPPNSNDDNVSNDSNDSNDSKEYNSCDDLLT